MILLKVYLARENKRRDLLAARARESGVGAGDFDEYGFLDVPDDTAPGGFRKEKVEKRFLDLTDGENLTFRYVL